MNPELEKKIKKEKKKEKKKNEKAVLNLIEPLRDNPERQAFVVKVYAIVSCQMLITVAMTAFVLAHEPAKEWVRENYWTHYVAMIIGIALICSLCCCMKNMRIVPRNYILLFMFTLCWSYMVAGFSQWFEPGDVITAAGITAGMTIGLTVFACCTKMKLTWLWGIGATISFAVWPLLLFCFIYPSKLLFNVIAFLIVILASIYIIFDTKLIIKKLNVDEYIIGALLLYLDIIQLFMWVLSLFGSN